MPNLVLSVSGSVAAYRAADLARELMRAGFTVRVCLTDAAQKFVSPALFEALTGQPCLIDAFEEPERGRMAHIDWARQADALVLAPATASTIARIAHGVGDDMLTTIALAYEGPMVVAPAMNPSMYASDTFRTALETLRQRAAMVVEPVEGDVACGEQGQGKLASIPAIVEAVLAVAARNKLLAGKKVLITSGPTREPIDAVRFLSNRSSGKMGIALARAAQLLGADVTIVTGPVREAMPLRVRVMRVETADEMMAAALASAADADIVIGAAAVADYRPKIRLEGKRRREPGAWTLALVPNPDILAALAKAARQGTMLVGFAAEPDEGLETAAQKVKRKGLAAIAVNDISRADIGFDADSNELSLVWADGTVEKGSRLPKLACALWLLERLVSRA